jgi:hypothetical protein
MTKYTKEEYTLSRQREKEKKVYQQRKDSANWKTSSQDGLGEAGSGMRGTDLAGGSQG